MESDSMKIEYNLEPSYTAVFLYREGCILGPYNPTNVQGLVWFTDGLGTEWTEAALCGPRLRLLFSLSKETCKIRLQK
jgi:hypothetical protein